MTGGPASCTASVNGGAPIVSGGAIPTSAVGPLTMVVTGKDAVGNVSTAKRSFTVVPAYRILLTYDAATR